MIVHAQPPDATAFAPFGVFVDAPARAGERQPYSAWLAPVGDLTPSFHTNLVTPGTPPLQVRRLERHPHAAQVFLPLKGSRYLVVVAPTAAGGAPDPAGVRAFVVPATLGVAYRPGVWHAGITALDGPASFAVMMWRGAAVDDEFADVAPWTVAVPDGASLDGPSLARGGLHA